MKNKDLLIEKTKRWLSQRNGIDILGRDICYLSLLLNTLNLFINQPIYNRAGNLVSIYG